jgi:DNA-binding transcriptional LysR family regulator
MADDLQLERHIGRRLKLRELYILSTVVQWGSMAKAADHLAMSQPAVSDAIANLEETLDVRLLDRNRRGVEPTIYALALLKRGTVVFDELRQGLRDIEFLSDPAAGEVRIACSQALAAGFVPAMIDEFSQRHPAVVFRLVEANTAAMEFRELRERNVDFMLGFVSRAMGDDDVNVDVLFDDQLFVVAGTQSRWAQRRKIELAELASEPWILGPPDNAVRALIVEAFRARGLAAPRDKVTSHSMPVRLHLLATGRFLTVIAGCVLRHNANRWSLKALPVDFGVHRLPIAIVTLKNRTLSPAVQLFIQHAQSVADSTTTTTARRSPKR